MFPSQLRLFFDGLEKTLKGAGILAGKSGRHMKFPYTVSAKIAQFPIFFYMKNNMIWMYYPYGMLLGLYAFMKIHILANSDANQRSWAESQRKAAEKEHQH